MPFTINPKSKSPRYVIVTGSPFDGMSIIGIWTNREKATKYAEKYIDDAWWIVSMEES